MKMIFGLLLAGLFFTQSLPGEVFGASEETIQSQADRWYRQRLQKFQQVEPYNQRRLERDLLQLEEGFEEQRHFNYHGLYPQFGTISTGSSLAAGVRYWRPNLFGSILDLQSSAAYSLNGYQQYTLQFGKIPQGPPGFFLRSSNFRSTSQFEKVPRKSGELFLYADLRYRDFPQEDFFGLGPQSREEDRTDFELKEADYEVVVGYQFNPRLRTDVRAGFLQVDIEPGTDGRFPATQELFNDAAAPGLTEQPNFFRLGPSLLFDYRDRPGNPHRGGMLGFSFGRYEDLDGNAFDFNRFAINARHYLPLGATSRVLAVQFFTSLDDADDAGQVPFYFQETLGGTDTLRGFDSFRFRDTNVLYFSAEYRWEPVSAVEFALFYDTGKVFADRSDFDFHDLENTFGFGVRLKTPNAVIFRADVGRSPEDTQIYFRFASSF